MNQISKLSLDSSWDSIANENFKDDIDFQQRAITIAMLKMDNSKAPLFKVREMVE